MWGVAFCFTQVGILRSEPVGAQSLPGLRSCNGIGIFSALHTPRFGRFHLASAVRSAVPSVFLLPDPLLRFKRALHGREEAEADAMLLIDLICGLLEQPRNMIANLLLYTYTPAGGEVRGLRGRRTLITIKPLPRCLLIPASILAMCYALCGV